MKLILDGYISEKYAYTPCWSLFYVILVLPSHSFKIGVFLWYELSAEHHIEVSRKIVYANEYIQNKKVLCSLRSGFRKFHSTGDQVPKKKSLRALLGYTSELLLYLGRLQVFCYIITFFFKQESVFYLVNGATKDRILLLIWSLFFSINVERYLYCLVLPVFQSRALHSVCGLHTNYWSVLLNFQLNLAAHTIVFMVIPCLYLVDFVYYM